MYALIKQINSKYYPGVDFAVVDINAEAKPLHDKAVNIFYSVLKYDDEIELWARTRNMLLEAEAAEESRLEFDQLLDEGYRLAEASGIKVNDLCLLNYIGR